MSQKIITFQSSCPLEGFCQVPAGIIICVAPDLLAQQPCAASETPDTWPYQTLSAILVDVTKVVSNGCVSWKYTVSFDEELIAEGKDILATDILGFFLKDCRSTWVEDEVGNEVTLIENEDKSFTFTSQHGCVTNLPSPALLCVTDSDSLNLSIDVGGCVTGDVNISDDVGNIIEIRADGLFAEAAGGSVCVTDSETIDFSIDGGGCVTGSVIIQPNGGENPTNILEATSQGLFVPEPTQEHFQGEINNQPGTGDLSTSALTVLANANAAPMTVNLPDATFFGDYIYIIKKIDVSGNAVTITPFGGQLIDGAANKVLTIPKQSVMIQADSSGPEWYILAGYL